MTNKNETRNPPQGNTGKHSRGQDWPVDVRIALARGVTDEGLSARQVARQLGVPYTTAAEWVKRVQNVNGVEIHYVENVKTGQVLDFKFVD